MWSTRQLADLAGTTVKAVRHYHSIGLLDEPVRAANGYKQYGARDLVRLLRVRRLVDLGIPLARVADLMAVDASPVEELRVVETELAATVDRLDRVRAELSALVEQGGAPDLPHPWSVAGAELGDADRAFLLVSSRVLTPAAKEALRAMLQDHERTAEDVAFERLPAEADEATRQQLAERWAPQVERLTRNYGWIAEPAALAANGSRHGDVLGRSLGELYNAAQLDVLLRLSLLVRRGEG
ncbi:MerR family transcriptional regulator [Frondihabitans sucicola]|nr:MerR family transcriptional regulator [Frondihabitans sucicola]